MDATTGVTHHYAEIGEVMLHYVTAGKGPPVVLIHGWPQTWYEWRHTIAALAPRYTVIAPDMRGLGDSSRPLTGYDKRTIGNDIWRLVTETLGHKRFLLVGHDWGGPTAFAIAADHPEAVEKLAREGLLRRRQRPADRVDLLDRRQPRVAQRGLGEQIRKFFRQLTNMRQMQVVDLLACAVLQALPVARIEQLLPALRPLLKQSLACLFCRQAAQACTLKQRLTQS